MHSGILHNMWFTHGYSKYICVKTKHLSGPITKCKEIFNSQSFAKVPKNTWEKGSRWKALWHIWKHFSSQPHFSYFVWTQKMKKGQNWSQSQWCDPGPLHLEMYTGLRNGCTIIHQTPSRPTLAMAWWIVIQNKITRKSTHDALVWALLELLLLLVLLVSLILFVLLVLLALLEKLVGLRSVSEFFGDELDSFKILEIGHFPPENTKDL